jgi:hypothetical protein
LRELSGEVKGDLDGTGTPNARLARTKSPPLHAMQRWTPRRK